MTGIYGLRAAAAAASMMLLVLVSGGRAQAQGFDAGKAPFEVRIRGDRIPYAKFFLVAMPGETLRIHANRHLRAEASAGHVKQREKSRVIEWTAPQASGDYRIVLGTDDAAGAMEITAFVLVPYGRMLDGKIEGYRIDAYPEKPLRGLDIYLPPRGFIRVTQQNESLPLSPHFTLGQFLCKQESGYPKFVALRPKLLLKLEALLAEVNARGIVADSFHIMSGYRTPYYNRLIQNVDYSRHLWGGAADIFIDETPRDGEMDDLNGDGIVDRKDAAVLFDIVEDFSRGAGQDYIGGAGEYDRNAAHGPFVHIDVRGQRARWGRKQP